MSTRKLLANVNLSNVNRDYAWYTITTLPNNEESYIRNLKDKFMSEGLTDYVKEYYVPIRYVKNPETNTIRKQKGDYSGYVFVKCILTSRVWHILRTTRGALVVLTAGGYPVETTPDQINRIRQQNAPEGFTNDEAFELKKKLYAEYKCKGVVKPALSDADFNTDFVQ